MTVREVLVAARALIDTPEKWVKGTVAAYANGDRCSVDSPKACRFCAYGSLLLATERDADLVRRAEQALDVAAGATDPFEYIRINDAPSTTHADVLALFDRAIAACPEVE